MRFELTKNNAGEPLLNDPNSPFLFELYGRDPSCQYVFRVCKEMSHLIDGLVGAIDIRPEKHVLHWEKGEGLKIVLPTKKNIGFGMNRIKINDTQVYVYQEVMTVLSSLGMGRYLRISKA